jgi:hypothetical protein
LILHQGNTRAFQSRFGARQPEPLDPASDPADRKEWVEDEFDPEKFSVDEVNNELG